MEATVVQLRYKMADVLKALERNESVKITHRGKIKGVIQPVPESSSLPAKDHPFFSLKRDESESVEAAMDRLRGGRCRDL